MTIMERIQAPQLDDIRVFLGTIPDDEYEARRRIRVCLNAAAYKLSQTDSQHARALCSMVTEAAIFWRYRPAAIEALDHAVAYMRNLLTLADQAEEMRALV